jgi:hypothetical protein
MFTDQYYPGAEWLPRCSSTFNLHYLASAANHETANISLFQHTRRSNLVATLPNDIDCPVGGNYEEPCKQRCDAVQSHGMLPIFCASIFRIEY